MKIIRRAPTMSPFAWTTSILLLLLLDVRVLAVCPSMCSCSRGHRTVDCSGRGLTHLPEGLQHNIRELNLSHNRLRDLDGRLSHFAHLRILDISHNQLPRLPGALPRALWDIRAAGNSLRQLHKNDTAYHWNLRALDLSANELERVVFINNTLASLSSLNLSHNKFWTVPTNMPYNLEMVDLSHNYLMQILPGSLDRLPRLARFYLHGNRFSAVGEEAFAQLADLQLITLYDNPWACEDEENMTDLQAWMEHTSARVLGCPCSTRHICGEAHLASTGHGWHYASYTEPPQSADARDASRPPMQAITSGHLSKSAPLDSAPDWSGIPADREAAGTPVPPTGTPRPISTQISTTVRTRSTKKTRPNGARSTGRVLSALDLHTVTASILLTATILSAF
ncbi:oligodendrocyte-myelin glycoprotein isoform X1 [Paramormyrops kingsleyae]|nr:oligodendrocyte-myelin glycoprotein [Paramormyrops kingsleyae]